MENADCLEESVWLQRHSDHSVSCMALCLRAFLSTPLTVYCRLSVQHCESESVFDLRSNGYLILILKHHNMSLSN